MSPSVFTILSQACSKGIGDGLSCSQMLSKSLMKFYPVSGCPEFTSLQRAVQRRRAFYFLPTEQHIIGTRTIVKSSSSFVMSGSNSSNEDETKTDDHLSRTSSNTRNPEVTSMKVARILDISPTVKEVVLKSDIIPPKITFKAGQWVDMFIPGLETVGGFSMCSSPQDLATKGTLTLAIKYSTHPPAHWIHTCCKVGDVLEVRVGGDFRLTYEELQPDSQILLIAGGVGINPLSSILRFLQDGKKDGSVNPQTRIYLLFSAKDANELLFKEIFETYRLSDPSFNATYFVTGNENQPDAKFTNRRLDKPDIQIAIKWLQFQEHTNRIQTYLCGPPTMISHVITILRELNLSTPHFEQWW